LGGWALKSVGQGYGDGYDLELLVKFISKMSNQSLIYLRSDLLNPHLIRTSLK
jgi:hypothetical protein